MLVFSRVPVYPGWFTGMPAIVRSKWSVCRKYIWGHAWNGITSLSCLASTILLMSLHYQPTPPLPLDFHMMTAIALMLQSMHGTVTFIWHILSGLYLHASLYTRLRKSYFLANHQHAENCVVHSVVNLKTFYWKHPSHCRKTRQHP